MRTPSESCLVLERQVAWRALSRAWAKTGKRIAARMAMMAITTKSSMRVKPFLRAVSMVRSFWLSDHGRLDLDRGFSRRRDIARRDRKFLRFGERRIRFGAKAVSACNSWSCLSWDWRLFEK